MSLKNLLRSTLILAIVLGVRPGALQADGEADSTEAARATAPPVLLESSTTPSARDTSSVAEFVDRTIDRLFGDRIEFGALVQTVGRVTFDPPPAGPGTNGFAVGTTRLRLSGGTGGFQYAAQTDFTRSPSVIDAYVGYSFSPKATLRAGLFKTPFSGEFLTSAAAIDFVNRSRVVGAYAPNRQIGLGLSGNLVPSFDYSVGMFNGNGRTLSGNDNNRFMYTGRVTFSPPMDEGELTIGGHASYSEDAYGGFRGTRTLVGADARLEHETWFLAGEMLTGRLDRENGALREPIGYHLTLGYSPVPDRHQFLVRLDRVDHDTTVDAPTQIVGGYNFFATEAFGLQLNYVAPVGSGADVGDHQILANLQVAL